jgi:hypothetical protein
MLEAALLVPFLLFTALACWDSARLITAHAALLSNADALAEWASSDPELEQGEFQMRYTGSVPPPPPPSPSPIPTPDPDLCLTALGYECQECTGSTCGGTCGGATAMISNLCDATTKVESTGIGELRLGSMKVRMNFVEPSAAPDQVEVIIEGQFNGLFLFPNEIIRVRKVLPYLGPR